MNSMIRHIIIAVLLLPQLVLASDFAVTPLLFDYELEERSIVTETITLTNNTDYRVIRLYASVNEITVGSGGEIKEFVTPSMTDQTNTVTSWIEFSRARIQLQPGETIEFPVTIRINPNAQPGRYHAFIGFADAQNRDEAEAKIKLGQGQGVLVKISLDEKRRDFLRLANFFINRFIVNEDNNALRYEITNPSDKPIAPTGEVIFYDARGNEVAATPVNPNQQSIDPGQTLMFEDSVPITDRVGRHKAFLSVEYGDNQLASVHDTTFFYMVPLKQLLFLFVIIMTIAVVVATIIHRRYLSPTEVTELDDAEAVALFQRSGVTTPAADHDIDLRSKT